MADEIVASITRTRDDICEMIANIDKQKEQEKKCWIDSAGDLYSNYLDAKGDFLRITSWLKGPEDGLLVEKWAFDRWTKVKTNDLLPIFIEGINKFLEGAEAIDEFLSDIPESVKARAALYQQEQLAVYRLMRLTDKAFDLAKANPALLLLLANRFSYGNWSARQAVKVLSLKQHHLLASFGINNTPKGTVRFFSKIRPGCFINSERVEMWMRSYNDRNYRLPMFVPIINDNLWKNVISCHSFALMDLPVFQKQGSQKEFQCSTIRRLEYLVFECHELGRELIIQNYLKVLNRLKSFEQLERLHDRWVDMKRKKMRLSNKKFPHPPLAANDVIVPIQTMKELYNEARSLHHCVDIYAEKIQAGRSYIYKVLSPQRGTLEINPQTLELVQFKLARNEEPDMQVNGVVLAWLSEVGGKDGRFMRKLRKSCS